MKHNYQKIDAFYKELATAINYTIGRNAVSTKLIKQAVNQARYIRQTQGIMGLYSFAQALPSQYFTEIELEAIKNSRKIRAYARTLIELLVFEKVLTPFEAMMLKRKLRNVM